MHALTVYEDSAKLERMRKESVKREMFEWIEVSPPDDTRQGRNKWWAFLSSILSIPSLLPSFLTLLKTNPSSIFTAHILLFPMYLKDHMCQRNEGVNGICKPTKNWTQCGMKGIICNPLLPPPVTIDPSQRITLVCRNVCLEYLSCSPFAPTYLLPRMQVHTAADHESGLIAEFFLALTLNSFTCLFYWNTTIFILSSVVLKDDLFIQSRVYYSHIFLVIIFEKISDFSEGLSSPVTFDLKILPPLNTFLIPGIDAHWVFHVFPLQDEWLSRKISILKLDEFPIERTAPIEAWKVNRNSH